MRLSFHACDVLYLELQMASCNDMAACPRSDAQSQPQTQQQQQREVRLETDEYFFRRGQTVRLSRSSSPERSSSRYQRLQFRRMYRYGLSLLLVGALCNWIGFVQHYFAPIRYLGVGCVIAGALCICIALGRWLSLRSHDSSANQVNMFVFARVIWRSAASFTRTKLKSLDTSLLNVEPT